jgi:hypothetical protein
MGHLEVKAATRVMVQAVLDFVEAHAFGSHDNRRKARLQLDKALDDMTAAEVVPESLAHGPDVRLTSEEDEQVAGLTLDDPLVTDVKVSAAVVGKLKAIDTAVAESAAALLTDIALAARGAATDTMKRAKARAPTESALQWHRLRQAFAAREIRRMQVLEEERAISEGRRPRSQRAIVREVAGRMGLPIEHARNAVRKPDTAAPKLGK